MLEPISDLFQVSVMELLKGERIKEDTSITMLDAQKMIDESIILSDGEITKKHKKHKTIILIFCVVTMFLVSLIMNIRNIMDGGNYTEVYLNRNSIAYKITTNERGEEIFIDPDAALGQMIEDAKEQGLQEELTHFLHILKNSMEDKN